jgi:hypothetical protein
MTPVWLASLPQNQFIGLSDERAPASLIRSNMEMGPAHQRPRFTAVPRTVKAPIVLTGQQRQDFDNFFINTLSQGALRFNWSDPMNDTTVTFRFTATPQWKLVAGGAPTTSRRWSAELELEILP